jgi:ubiquinone/menaquinone biosynthesis C-methylase UbiE
LEGLASLDGPIVDLASGRCYLVEEIIRRLPRQVIATDFSLAVLRRDRSYFQFLGLDEFVSFLAFDARKTPFKDGAITTMTTNLGLPNIEDPGSLMIELKRIVDGTLLAIMHFFPEEDELNRQVIEDAGLDAFNYQGSALRCFGESGWLAKVENACTGPALPTPESTIFEGARADGLPVAPTELNWCTIRATSRA